MHQDRPIYQGPLTLLVGVFQFDIVAWLFGGQGAILSRILYTIIGAAGVWCITLLFKNNRST